MMRWLEPEEIATVLWWSDDAVCDVDTQHQGTRILDAGPAGLIVYCDLDWPTRENGDAEDVMGSTGIIWVCAACGTPIESEPCEDHQPIAYTRCNAS